MIKIQEVKNNIEINLTPTGYREYYSTIINYNGKKYEITALLFEEPSWFGIDNGKISKLSIAILDDDWNRNLVCNYDRGWDVKPKGDAKKIYDAIISKYN